MTAAEAKARQQANKAARDLAAAEVDNSEFVLALLRRAVERKNSPRLWLPYSELTAGTKRRLAELGYRFEGEQENSHWCGHWVVWE